jgi:hypothetical protein
LKEKTKAYVAGLLDAEGCIEIAKGILPNTIQYLSRLKISNKDKRVMNYLVSHFGGTFKKEPNNDDWMYNWRITNAKHMTWFLSTILPYTQIKTQEALVALEYCNLNGVKDPQRREVLYLRSRELKDRSVETKTQGFSDKDKLVNAYYAALFDGEGDISIDRFYPRGRESACYYGHVRCKNTFKPIIDLMVPRYAGATSTIHENHSDWSPQRVWRLSRKDYLEKFLLKTLPYLIIKRDRAKLLLNFIRLKIGPQHEQRQRMFDEMYKLNHPSENMI